jgi:hypothetical protein
MARTTRPHVTARRVANNTAGARSIANPVIGNAAAARIAANQTAGLAVGRRAAALPGSNVAAPPAVTVRPRAAPVVATPRRPTGRGR